MESQGLSKDEGTVAKKKKTIIMRRKVPRQSVTSKTKLDATDPDLA